MLNFEEHIALRWHIIYIMNIFISESFPAVSF